MRRLIRFLLLLWLLVTAATEAKSQEKPIQLISGQVVGNDSLPAIGVAVIMQHIDSTYIGATITDADGHFTLNHPNKRYRLLFQHVSYIPYTLETAEKRLGIIQLNEDTKTLGEVTITAQRPLVKMADDKLIYNPAPILENKIISSAYDLIQELPGIQKSSEGLTINGATGKTHIAINGKLSSMTEEQLQDYLKSLSAERVEKVEIAYNAPAQWHIRGAAINIILKKDTSRNVQGQLKAGWDHTGKNTDSYNGGGNIYFSNKKISTDFLYKYTDDRWKNRTETESKHTVGDDVYDIQTDNREQWHSKRHNIYTSLNYTPAQKQNISLSYNGQFNPHRTGKTCNESNLFADAAARNKENSDLHNLCIAYDSPFGLNTGAEYTYYENSRNQDMSYISERQKEGTTFLYKCNQRIDKANFFADMAHSLPHNWNLSYGVKYDYANSTNKQRYTDVANEGENNYASSSNTKEHDARAYIGISKALFDNKLKINTSLTGVAYKINDYRKKDILPNATVTYTPNTKHVLQLSYNTLRQYPSYWQRQEYTSHADEYTTYYGNQELKPARTSYANFLYILKSRYIFQMSYYKVDDFIIMQSYQLPDKLEMAYQSINMDYSSAFTISTVIPVNIGKVLNSIIVGNVYNERYKNSSWYDLSYDRNQWAYSIIANNTLTVSKKPQISFDVNVLYSSPTIQGIWDLENRWGIDASVKCAFANGKAILSLECDDVFESKYPSIKIRHHLQHQNINSNFYKRTFYATFTYKFNNYKEKNKKAVDTSRFGAK